MIRFGLCCLFNEEPIKFRHATAKNLQKYDKSERLKRLSEICLDNSLSLRKAVETVTALDIKAFRVMTPLFPLYTHPDVGYQLDFLPDKEKIIGQLAEVKKISNDNDIRLSFHPDQFNVLNSPHAEVVERSFTELNYQAMLAGFIGADVINIHLGGVYGDKDIARKRFIENFFLLPDAVRQKLTIENDDKSYTPEDLEPVCEETGIPLVYDIHHHRCNNDTFSVEQATDLSIKTWQRVGREPYFHISSPKLGWNSNNTKSHSDYIDMNDFPAYWLTLKTSFTLDVEAKAKEPAVLKLKKELFP